MSCRSTTISSSSGHGSTRRPRPSPSSLVEPCSSTLICQLPSWWSPTPPSSPTTARPSATTRPQRTNLGTSGRSSPHPRASSSSSRSTREETRSVRQSLLFKTEGRWTDTDAHPSSGSPLLAASLNRSLSLLSAASGPPLATSPPCTVILKIDSLEKAGWTTFWRAKGDGDCFVRSHRTVLAEGPNVRITSES